MTSLEAFQEIVKIAHDLTGVQLNDRHIDMVKSRLQRRLDDLGLQSIAEYVDYFRGHRPTEEPLLVGLLTTHHTYFFREFGHFEFLLEKALPALKEAVLERPDRTLKIWSAACSRGQEAYSLAMWLDLHLPKIIPGAKFEILGTDIDPQSISVAENGVYSREELKEVPLSLLGRHWSPGTGEISSYVKARASLRDRCRFRAGNLLSIAPNTYSKGEFDLVFCRNVFIYFNPTQIRKISEALIDALNPKGFLFVGISESLTQLKLPVKAQGPSVYRHVSAAQATDQPAPIRPTQGPSPARAPIRVLCVDDSPSVLAILRKALEAKKDMVVVGTASNGIEAARKVSELKPDALTLDIHMPGQDGIEYLQASFGPTHPPVIMVSSVSREQNDLAGRALELGASDFVEKPVLANISKVGEEIRNKIRCAISARRPSMTERSVNVSLFSKSRVAVPPTQALRVVALNLSSRDALARTLRELVGPQPPCVVLVDGSKGALGPFAMLLAKSTGREVSAPDALPSDLPVGSITVLDLATQSDFLRKVHGSRTRVSILVYGELTPESHALVSAYAGAQILLEDIGRQRGSPALDRVAMDVVPCTSFAYMSHEFLASLPAKKAA